MIFQVIEFFEEKRRKEVNDLSITTAIGWSGLFNGLGGKGSPKCEPIDFLPFRDSQTDDRLSPGTRRILKYLAATRQIPEVFAPILATL